MTRLWPGLALACALAAACEFVTARKLLPFDVPAVVVALLLGALVGNLLPRERRTRLAPGLQVFTKRVLKVAIVLLGLKLTAQQARDLGGPVLALIGACLVLGMFVGALLGRPFGVSRRVAVLLGCGTAICGATAVVTIGPLVEADDDEIAFSIATIFLFNVVALLLFPDLGHRLGLSDLQFGAWVGTAVNDTSAVVATGQAYSDGARTYATAIKLVRTLALVPMAVLVATLAARARGEDGTGRLSIGKVFPWFVLGFAGMAVLANVVPIPEPLARAATRLSGWAITAVLAAVGLNLDSRKILGSGTRSLALGMAIATVVAVASLALVRSLGIG